MDDPTLVKFPLPVLTAFLCCVIATFVWRLDLGVRRATVTFSALFTLCAVEALLVGLRFGYGIETLMPLQSTLPLLLGPLMYLGFAALTGGVRTFRKIMAFHLAAPLIALAVFWFFIEDQRTFDWVISASYLFYSVALFRLWRKGPDVLTHARLEVTRSVSNWMLRGIGLLVFILALDATIAVDFALNQGTNVAALISYGTAPLIVILLAALVKLPSILSEAGTKKHAADKGDPTDSETLCRLDQLMLNDQLFLDPNLTMQRLAKRLHLPARKVSAAVNKAKGINISQYVNEFRLAYAADLLVSGNESVARIAEMSGFMTRSNFYREFQRVYDQSPTEYRSTRPLANEQPTME